MGKARKTPSAGNVKGGHSVDDQIFWLALSLLVAVPLAFSTLVYTRYTLPKFVVLIIGSSVLTLLLAIRVARSRASEPVRIRSRLLWIAGLYFAIVGISTIFGVAPLASLFGSHFNYMGFLTRICFLIVLAALIAGIGASEKRLCFVFWGMAVTGLLTAAYGVAQAFGIEPFVSRNLYTFTSPEGPLVRVSGTLGHSNYLGNFLVYTTPISVALALVGPRKLRLLAAAGAMLSVGAIVFSGTRGAWIGIIAGGVVFVLLELRRGAVAFVRSHPSAFAMSMLLAVVLLAAVVAISPASRSVRERMNALIEEGTSSSGRLLLWRDSLQMVPAFSLVGCGPEGFRRAFLGFKSKALAQLSPRANNESPHNAYLEVAISNGLAGALLYASMIGLAVGLLLRARNRAVDRNLRIILTGVVSAFAAALVHNIFIFDQVATGLYFFAFIGLAQAASNVTIIRNAPGSKEPGLAWARETSAEAPRRWGFASGVLAAGASLLIAGSVWYSAGLIRADHAYRELLGPLNPADFDALTDLGERITSSPLPTGAYDFVFARAVNTIIKDLSRTLSPTGKPHSSEFDPDLFRNRATRLGIEHTRRSLAHTLTPELNYTLLASLYLAAGDVDRFRDAAIEAVRWDPNNYQTRWLRAEAHLVRGERDQAAREAEIALELYQVSPEAASVLARARGADPADDSHALEVVARLQSTNPQVKRTPEQLIDAARKLVHTKKMKAARISLMTAIFKSEGYCPVCHRELALIYEQMGRWRAAIAEWEKYANQAPEREADEKIKARIESLKQRSNPKQ